MAPSPEAVADLYRMTQARIAGEAAGRAALAFNAILDPSALDATFAEYLRVLEAVIEGARRSAAIAGSDFYLNHREAAGIPGPPPAIVLADSLPSAQVATVALVTGPVAVKQSIARGDTLPDALNKAAALTAGSVFRLAANGGRETIDKTVMSDDRAIGWARKTDGKPCAFCAMLASRGPVYKSQETAMGRTKRYHGRCGCVPVPVYRKSDPWPAGSREFARLWAESTSGAHGRDAINAFRRAYERPAE